MAPQPELSRLPGSLGQVDLRLLLAGNGGGKGQAEALLPTGEGVVGSPESQVSGAVREKHGEGGKLGVLIQHALKSAQRERGEPGALGQTADQRRNLPGHHRPGAVPPRPGGELVHRLSQGQGLGIVRSRQNAPEPAVGQQGQNEAVHLAEGGLGKGQAALPVQIVQAVGPGHGQ